MRDDNGEDAQALLEQQEIEADAEFSVWLDRINFELREVANGN